MLFPVQGTYEIICHSCSSSNGAVPFSTDRVKIYYQIKCCDTITGALPEALLELIPKTIIRTIRNMNMVFY